mmetsp:Transcript_14016/g.38739  ORF Transcript_14016/g.38739 Transcript_14016/m.38739 type:complete len:840 (-) Transcript_14016:94-2613(-)
MGRNPRIQEQNDSFGVAPAGWDMEDINGGDDDKINSFSTYSLGSSADVSREIGTNAWNLYDHDVPTSPRRRKRAHCVYPAVMVLVALLAGAALVIVLLRQSNNRGASASNSLDGSNGNDNRDFGKDNRTESEPPTNQPMVNPSPAPIHQPQSSPTSSFPTFAPSVVPSTTVPPSVVPSIVPTTVNPTENPSATPTEVRLVSRGLGGRLVYAGYENQVGAMNPGTVGGGATNVVPDFSTAGYQKGEVPIPFVEVAGENATVYPTGANEDDSERIQVAIDYVASLPLDSNGFRGAVLIKAGEYNIFHPALQVRDSGIVIRGEGSSRQAGTTIWYHYTDPADGVEDRSTLFELGTKSGNGGVVEKFNTKIADDYVPVGATILTVEDASSFVAGEEVVVTQQVNDDWLLHMSNMGQYDWTPEQYSRRFWRRRIVHIEDNTILFDAPIVQAIEAQYGGGFVKRYTFLDEVSNIGIESLRLLSSPDTPDDEDHGQYAIRFNRVKNGWVRQVSASFFWGGVVQVQAFSSYVTIEDSSMTKHTSRIQGGRRYAFNLNDAEFVLVQRCLASHGRHDFVTGSQTNGPNVFVDNLSLNSFSDNGPHHRYSTGLLMDSIKSLSAESDSEEHSNFHVQNRGASGSGHGWSGAQVMFWNLEGKVICDAPNGAMNWAIGCVGQIVDDERWTSISPEEPRGIFQSHGQHVSDIRSLFYSQLHDRIGTNNPAYHSSFLPEQKQSYIWSDLQNWDGDGLFLSPLVTWVDDDALPVAFNSQNVSLPLKIGGIVRDLNLLGMEFTSTWSQSEGPTMTFDDTSQLETTVTFSGKGLYLFGLTVSSRLGTIAYYAPAQVMI